MVLVKLHIDWIKIKYQNQNSNEVKHLEDNDSGIKHAEPSVLSNE